MPEQSRNKVWVNEKCHESYAKNYSLVYPNDQPLSGRNFKLSPFHEVHLCFYYINKRTFYNYKLTFLFYESEANAKSLVM